MYVLSVVSINYPRGTYKLSNSVARTVVANSFQYPVIHDSFYNERMNFIFNMNTQQTSIPAIHEIQLQLTVNHEDRRTSVFSPHSHKVQHLGTEYILNALPANE